MLLAGGLGTPFLCSRDAEQLHVIEVAFVLNWRLLAAMLPMLSLQVSSQYEQMADCQYSPSVPHTDRRSKLSAARSISRDVQLHVPRLQGRTDHTGQLCHESESTRRQLRFRPSSDYASQASSRSPRVLQ